MPSSGNERRLLAFRKTRENRFTLPPLLGTLEKEGFARPFRILIAASAAEIIQEAGGAGGVVGFSFMTPSLSQVRKELENLRKSLPRHFLFLAGGAHASGDPMGTLQMGFDFVFVGESEETLPSFLHQFLEGKLPPGKILTGGRESFLVPSHPPHFLEERFFSPIEITRGCFYHCTFCQTPRIFGHSLRHRRPENLAGYLKQAIPYGYDQSKFISPNAFSYGATHPRGPDLGAIEELLAISRETGVRGIHFGCFPSEVRPDWVNPEILQVVKKYCRNRTIVLGAQSGSDILLTKLQRGHTAEQALEAARWVFQAGFRPHVDFVFGFPEETMEDRHESLVLMAKMIEEFRAKIHAHTYLPLPGTPLFGKDPSRVDAGTKNTLKGWEEKKNLDGWWREQEIMAWKIVSWRDQGQIRVNP